MNNTQETINIDQLDFYSFFTKYSLMDEYGFVSGLVNRLFRKVLPPVPDQNTIEYVLLDKTNTISGVISKIDLTRIEESNICQQLDLSIKALCSKVVAFGIDSNIKAKYNYLQLDSKPFEGLLERINKLTSYQDSDTVDLMDSLESIEALVNDLRKNKRKIGTNFHLTLTTSKILEYTTRIKELLNLKLNITSSKHWETMFTEFVEYSKSKHSIRRYIHRHSDLVALEIVEHTSSKGEKYIAESRREYWSFFRKALLGGGIIAVFAFVKLVITSYGLSPMRNAILYSINYALCFIIVKQVGGIIATKQPAMTASTIAKNIDRQDDLKIDSIASITTLVRKVFRTQFISIMGNFLMALTFASFGLYLLQVTDAFDLTKIVKADYLIKGVLPSGQLIFFAAIAGLFLALSGLISGYVDNKVVVSKIKHRVINSPLFLRSERLASFIHKKAGSLLGNISLGFLLGSIFLLSYLLPFQVDIRHIAFSSAYVGFSILSYDFGSTTILLALLGALMIGVVNFLVSFSITLFLTLKSRGASLKIIPLLLWTVTKDFFFNPLHYFLRMEENPK